MKVLELFSGTGSFHKEAKKLGYETFTIDNDKQFNPDLCIDIMQLEAKDILEKFGQPDIIWASPPCTNFSVASIYRHWKDGYPKDYQTFISLALVQKTIELINELKPKYYFIENPRGMLRKQKVMNQIEIRNTVTYCQYGFDIQKATDIWTNCKEWTPKPMCSPRSPCHIRSPRGSKFGVQGIKARKGFHSDSRYTQSRSPIKRAIIPPELCKEILESCK